jgi:hypothetical protein
MQLRCSHCRGYCRGRGRCQRSRGVPFFAIDFLVSLQWVQVSHKQKLVLEASIEVKAAVEVLRLHEATVEVFEAAAEL